MPSHIGASNHPLSDVRRSSPYWSHFHVMIYALDLIGTIVFAISGALLAMSRQRNYAWVLVYALLTALGGGTIRDLLFHRPVFWSVDPNYLGLAMIVGLFIVAFVQWFPLKQTQLFVFDKVSMATFTVVGAQVALHHAPLFSVSHLGWICVPLIGLLTSFGGGITRDLLSVQKPQVLNDPYDILASIIGSSLYCIFFSAHIAEAVIAPVAIAILVTIRLWVEPSRQRLVTMGHQ